MGLQLHSLSERLQHKKTLYVSSNVKDLFLRGNNLVAVSSDQEEEKRIPLEMLRRVVLLGKPSFGSSVLYDLLRADVPMDWLDRFGRPVGAICPVSSADGKIRLAQDKFCASTGALTLAKSVITAKIDNICGLIRRRAQIPASWWNARNRVVHANNCASLRGAEGMAANIYFGFWGEWSAPFSWNGRKPHPAPDPVNTLLSLGYGLLHNRLASALRHYGLDPRQGFFHVGRGSHCALASDLMEDMRFAVDSTVLRLLHGNTLSAEHFQMKDQRCVIVNHETFSHVFEAFENMFNREWACLGEDGKTSVRSSLNDRIDTAAEHFCKLVQGQGEYRPFRRTTWVIA